MAHDCKYEEVIAEMRQDIRELLTEFKHMNGQLLSTKRKFEKHDDESIYFRGKVTEIWAIIQTIKWAIGLLFAGGMLWKIVIWLANTGG